MMASHPKPKESKTDERSDSRVRSRARRHKRKERLLSVNPTAIAVGLIILLIFWILISVYLTFTPLPATYNNNNNNNNILHGGMVSSHMNLRHYDTIPKTTTTKTTTTITEEIIDMRNLSATLAFDNPDGGVWKQGWDIQLTKQQQTQDLTIYVVPHSHCDPGWIKTFDEYFQSQTKSILTTVVQALAKDRRRTFVWAEISYFEWWWKEQSHSIQELTRTLLQNHQLEFVTGGWVQPDEANTQLYAMEIQLQEGHDFIHTEFGSEFIPTYGWSIDPFGYSPTMAYLLKQYGFKAMVIQRVHYAIKKELAKRHHLEFMWRQTWDKEEDEDEENGGGNNKNKNHNHHNFDIFTHVMPFFSYDVPHTCGPDPSVCCQFDFARLTNYGGCPWHKPPQIITSQNVKERSLLLLDQYRKKASLYRNSKVVLVPLGDDFRYRTSSEAELQYENYQVIMDYINANIPGVTMQFGTLRDYFTKVMMEEEQETTTTTTTLDSNTTTTVPVLKGSFFTYADRDEDYWSGYFTSRIFDKALDRKLERVLFAATTLGATKEELRESRRALSLFQHHDGVTGTAKDHVVRDYASRIHNAIRTVQEWMKHTLKPQSSSPTNNNNNNSSSNYFEPCWQSDAPREQGQNLCGNDGEVYAYNPLETSQFCGEREVGGHTMELVQLPCEVPGPRRLSTNNVRFDSSTGLMTFPVKEQWMVWKVRQGGAYLFVPDRLATYDEDTITTTTTSSKKVELDGYVVTTPHWNRTVIVHDITDEFGETDTTTVIDFIYETDLQTANEEWFARFSSDIQNHGVFHTDLNGFNFDTHYFRKDLPIQSQVFPMPTLASIEDGNMRMTVLSEHAQGTASLQDGSIDIWLDRRLNQDDNRGLFQGVMDNVPTRTRLRLVLESEGYNTKGEFAITPLCRRMWDELNHPLEMFGTLRYKTAHEAKSHSGSHSMVTTTTAKTVQAHRRAEFEKRLDPDQVKKDVLKTWKNKTTTTTTTTTAKKVSNIVGWNKTLSEPVVPFVYMVHNRVDYFKIALDTLLASDFCQNNKRVPLIISHDGHIPDMMLLVEELKTQFSHVIQIFHPFSCVDHPNSFPGGNDETLNTNYTGDSFGNPRDGRITCCRHHFTWMIKTVFDMEFPELDNNHVDAFLFLEEDYVVSPTIYETVLSGLRLYHQLSNDDTEGYFGVTLDGSGAAAAAAVVSQKQTNHKSNDNEEQVLEEGWEIKRFTSGPMVITRDIWKRFQQHAVEYCTYDDYNWDWAIVHLMDKGVLPSRVLYPNKPQVMHIGVDGGGLHGEKNRPKWHLSNVLHAPFPGPFHGTKFVGTTKHVGQPKTATTQLYGGWGHPADHEHCLKILQG